MVITRKSKVKSCGLDPRGCRPAADAHRAEGVGMGAAEPQVQAVAQAVGARATARMPPAGAVGLVGAAATERPRAPGEAAAADPP